MTESAGRPLFAAVKPLVDVLGTSPCDTGPGLVQHAGGRWRGKRFTRCAPVRFSLPNNHHFLVDLESFGLTNDNEVCLAVDRPYGLIEGTILRDGVEAVMSADLTNL